MKKMFIKICIYENSTYLCQVIKNKNMKTLKKFTIWISTEFGTGCFTIKAKDFTDAFLRLGKKDKMKDGFIVDEDGESQTFNFILGLEE